MKEGTLNEEALLVKLKLQKEIEREEKEQALLREASAPMMVDTLPAFPTAPASDEKLDEQTRLQRLKEQRENERSEKERALWSEASSPPKLFVDEELVSPEPSPAEGSADESGDEKQTKGFFAKLRRKKSP